MPTYPSIAAPQFPLKTKHSWNTSIVKYQGGSEQRISNRDAVIRVYEITYVALSETDKDLLVDFYNARKGSFESFEWDNPESDESHTTMTVRFQEDELNQDFFMYNLWKFNKVTLIEVI